MASCEQGYLCDVCGEEVHSIRESELYLRYVTGQISAQELLSSPERHLTCHPVAAQFIDDPAFGQVTADGPFARDQLDPEFTRRQAELMTRGWQRLQQLGQSAGSVPISDYPLPEFRGGTDG